MEVTVAVAQYPITQHSSLKAWALHVEAWIKEAVAKGAQLLVFPEYGSMELTSLLPDSQDLAEQTSAMTQWLDPFLTTFETLAKKYRVMLVAPSLPVAAEGRKVNRAYVFAPGGLAGYQDKFFMTRFEDEEWGISPGKKQLTLFEADWGSFGVQICYDVEFGIGAHYLAMAGAGLIVAPSCTEAIRGAARVHVGARARALENQAYVAVAQTVGMAEWSPAVDVNYGYAAVYAPPDVGMPEDGICAAGVPQHPCWVVATLQFGKLQEVRANGAVLNYRDHRHIAMSLLTETIGIQKVRVF